MWLCEKSKQQTVCFFLVILTCKNEKLLESSVSKVNFIFLCFEFM